MANVFCMLVDEAGNASMKYDDGTIVPMPPKPNKHVVWDAPNRTWMDPRNLELVRKDQWDKIKVERDAAEYGGFKWDYVLFDSNLVSQSRVQGAVAMAKLQGAEFSIVWTLADNTVRTLSADDMIAVGVCMGEHISAVHAHARAKRDEINNATTAEAIEAIVW